MQPNTYIQEDDAWIYHQAWIYRRENQELQNLNNHETINQRASD